MYNTIKVEDLHTGVTDNFDAICKYIREGNNGLLEKCAKKYEFVREIIMANATLATIMSINFPGRWKAYYQMEKYHMLFFVKKFNPDELDAILNDMKSKHQCFAFHRTLLEKYMLQDKIQGYETTSMQINVENLDLIDPDLIQKRTKKATIIISNVNQIDSLLDNFERIQAIPNKFVEFKKDQRVNRRLYDLNNLDCTFINPFYLYFDNDVLPEKVIWKIKGNFPRPPEKLVPIYPEFKIYDRKMDDLKTQLKKANVCLKSGKYQELQMALEPLYDYELTEDEVFMLRKQTFCSKILLLPLINNPMIAHLMSGTVFENAHIELYRIVEWRKISKHLRHYRYSSGGAVIIAEAVPELTVRHYFWLRLNN
ncbi:MAG: hypothetical protein CMM93_03065 [Rickettsiales bacterium]|nr:hypothetical protein [Rickettsiales bacterium]|tara:strand:- start:4236 stop:5339 length:1104 start_codon:yes stop_codon:yes gene_type:complete